MQYYQYMSTYRPGLQGLSPALHPPAAHAPSIAQCGFPVLETRERARKRVQRPLLRLRDRASFPALGQSWSPPSLSYCAGWAANQYCRSAPNSFVLIHPLFLTITISSVSSAALSLNTVAAISGSTPARNFTLDFLLGFGRPFL